MAKYLRPQSPIYSEENAAYIYPITTVDQVVMPNGTRLNAKLESIVTETKDKLMDEAIVLVEGVHYGDSLPTANTPGRLFFVKVTE